MLKKKVLNSIPGVEVDRSLKENKSFLALGPIISKIL